MAEQVFQLMQRDVLCLQSTTTVAEATWLLTEAKLSSAPVLDPKGDYMGVLTCRDLLAFNLTSDRNPRATHVWEVHCLKHVTVSPAVTIREAKVDGG